MAVLRLTLVIALVLFLSSCAGTYRSYIDMFQVAFTPKQDVSLTFKMLQEAPNDFLYVRSGDNARAALGLMFVENNQFKWISASKELLVTEYGRIVRTQGLVNDLLYLSNLAADPIRLGQSVNGSWQRSADWRLGEFGYTIRSEFETPVEETLIFFGQEVKVIKIIETVTYDNPSNYLRFGQQWQNVFWVEPETGTVLKSVQQLAPNVAPMELIFISEVARQLKRSGVVVSEDAV